MPEQAIDRQAQQANFNARIRHEAALRGSKMKENREYRYIPFVTRQTEDGQTVVEGTVIRYGDVADIGGWFTEEFRAGWVTNWSDLMIVNRMHKRDQPLATSERGLVCKDSPKEMTQETILPDTTYGRDAATEVDLGLLRGLSLEFLVDKDEYDYKKDHRVVVKGRMFGFGIVDRPAYPDSIAQIKRAQEYRQHYGLSVPEPEPKAKAVRVHRFSPV